MLVAYVDCFAGLSSDTLLEALFNVGLSREQVTRALAPLGGAEGLAGEADPEVFRRAVAGSALPPVVKQAANIVLGKLNEAATAAEKENELGSDRQEWSGRELRAAVGVVLGLALMGIGRVECSSLRVGGQVEGGTGRLILSPVTARILRCASIPVYGSNQDRELVTPVGAALVATLASKFGPLPAMNIRAIGFGKEIVGEDGGSRLPRQTRIFLGESAYLEVISTQLLGVRPQQAAINASVKQQSPSDMPETEPAPSPVPAVPAVPAVVTTSARREAATNEAKTGTEANPTISPSAEWVALSIQGHQQSGRQRV